MTIPLFWGVNLYNPTFQHATCHQSPYCGYNILSLFMGNDHPLTDRKIDHVLIMAHCVSYIYSIVSPSRIHEVPNYC